MPVGIQEKFPNLFVQYANLYCSDTAVIKIPKNKSQIANKFQFPKFKTCLGHWLLELDIYL
jgi:hypothetical protein